jgi:hypothetical protein
MQLTLASVLTFASAALAITVTSPAKDAVWDLSGDNKISWASVRYFEIQPILFYISSTEN